MSLPFLLIFALYALSPVTVSVSQPAGTHQTEFRGRARIERSADNRQLCLGINGPELKGGCYQLDGDATPVTFERWWTHLTGGHYEAIADLVRIEAGRERHYLARAGFDVLSEF